MFKKLKDKIAEEVKQSPLKSVQQLAQAVVSPSSSSVFEPSSSNDKFCIEEGDIEENERQEAAKPGGFTSVTLTGQTTSPVRHQAPKHGLRASPGTQPGSLMAEADNFFPKFEPQPTNFHVQSDWESASEVEDRGSQLEHINKESLYEAYRKVYNRYNRMKNKYHEIVTHYRQLERETEKAKTVLTETQDKALLRISELREQCLLEQQAKAHLEEALRNELEERDHIINTLKTKVQYLKGASDSTAPLSLDTSILSKEEANLIDFTDSSVSSVPLPIDASSSEEKINLFEEKVKSLITLLSENSFKVEELKNKLKEVRIKNVANADAIEENVGGNEPPTPLQQTEKDLNKAVSELISKLSVEVQNLQKSVVHCASFKSLNSVPNLELETTEEIGKKPLGNNNVQQIEEELDRCSASNKELTEQNKTLIERLNEERFSAKELKSEFNTLSSITDILRRKIKLSNENFGKNDAINCLITDTENNLIKEWNLCFQNFLQTRCEVTVLKDTRDDLEKELFRVKEEINKSENMNKEILEENSRLKGEIEFLQKDLKNYISQLESLSMEKGDLKVSCEALQKQNKEIEDALSHYQKVSNEKHGDLQKIADEKHLAEAKVTSLESELVHIRSEYSLLLEAKQKLDFEVSSLRQENGDIIGEKDSLNNKINEMENKLKQVEDDYKMALDTRDGLDNQINSLTKLTEELSTEKSCILNNISDLEKDLQNKRQEISLLLEEKDKLVYELEHIKNKNESINTENLSIKEKLHDLAKELENTKQSYINSLETTQVQSDETTSLKQERDELFNEKFILESKIKNLNDDFEKLKLNYSEVEQIKESAYKELTSVKKERDKLLLEIESAQNRIVEFTSISKTANEELLVLKKENVDLMTERDNLQKEIHKLEECLELNTKIYTSSSESNAKLSHELSSLEKERNDLLQEKSTLEKQLSELQYNLSANEESLSKELTQMSEKLIVLQKEYEDLMSSRQTNQGTLNEIQDELKQKDEMLLSVNDKNKLLSEQIKTVQNDYNKIENECALLQEKYNCSVAECESNKANISSLADMKNKLSEEVITLQNDFENSLKGLNEIKAKLETERNTSLALKDQLCSVSETLKKKCEESTEKYQENLSLQTEIEKLMEKITVLNSCIEKLTKEKNIVLKYLLANLNNVKLIKELQRNLFDFVKRFQAEISHKINDINSKMGHDLLKHLNDLLDPETCSTKFMEVECKRKEDIDLYNAKLKNLHEQKSSEEVFQVKASALENVYSVENEPMSKTVAFRQMGHLEKLTGLDSCDSRDAEAYLKQAISLMKSFTNLINHNSLSSEYSDDIITSVNERFLRLNEIDGKNLQKEIIAIESFITDWETNYKDICFSSNKSQKLNASVNVLENDNFRDVQLRQDIRLKDDIIKKLQSVIEEYEQKKDIDDSEFIYKQKVQMLEQENKSLTERLQKLQETHELNVKNLISEYEKKLVEIEEDTNMYEIEKLGKENKHVVNEMKEHILNLQQDLEERGDAFEKLYEEHQQSVKSLDKEIHQLRSNHDKELREQDKKWRQCLDRRLAEEETRHQQELTTLNAQWNAERRELETARRLAVNAVESGSGSNELLRRQVQALTVQLTELQNNRCEACDRKRKHDVGQDNRLRSVQDCTEMEYLRNILYEYMMGKEPLVLAKVLCALVKFDEDQTKEIVSKEEHRITLFGQLGLL